MYNTVHHMSKKVKKKRGKLKKLEDAYVESNVNVHECKHKYYGDIYDKVS